MDLMCYNNGLNGLIHRKPSLNHVITYNHILAINNHVVNRLHRYWIIAFERCMRGKYLGSKDLYFVGALGFQPMLLLVLKELRDNKGQNG